MADLRSRIPAQTLMEKTLQLHDGGPAGPTGEAAPWYRGALGEIAVAGLLAQLPSEWTVLHSVPVGNGDSDIDHVLVGPPGAFTLNTKSSPNAKLWVGGHGLFVDGQKTRYVANAIHEASRAAHVLSSASGLTVPVTPLIVFVRPGSRVDKAPVEGSAVVLADHELLQWLVGRRREFSDEQVARIADAAVQPRTWSAVDRAITADPRLAVRFHALVAHDLQGVLPRLQRNDNGRPVPEIAAPARRATPARSTAGGAGGRRQRRSWVSRLAGLAGALAMFGLVWILLTGVLPALVSAMVNR